MIDTEHVSVDFLETLGKQGVIISNKAELVNVSEVNDSAVAVQELNDILYNRYIQDDISKYDKTTHTIVECLLEDGTEIEFPDYSYFKGIYLFPVEYIEDFIFQNIFFTGNFKMDNLKIVSDYAFINSNFTGDLILPKCTHIKNQAFKYSHFNGALNLDSCTLIEYHAFLSSNFTGNAVFPVCTWFGADCFNESHFSDILYIPLCTNISLRAFDKSNFSEITIGANAVLGSNCIGAHSSEFILDYADNGKLAGTYVWDGQHWIYQE